MTSNELITRKNIELALLNKGQHSRRYKLGDIWELNYYEIREVLDDVDADAQPKVHGEWIELHDYERIHTIYMINTNNICTIYPGQTGSGKCFTRVILANGGEIYARESMKEISELMRKEVDE